MKRKFIYLNVLVFLLGFSLSSCRDTVHVNSFEFEDETQEEDNVNLVRESIAPLNNPDRGFHFEIKYNVADGSLNDFINIDNAFKGGNFPKGFIDDSNKHWKTQDDAISLSQAYLYLTPWIEKDLPAQVLQNIQDYFDEYKKKGHKMILRFVYKSEEMSPAVTVGGIEKHMQQLKPLIEKNKGLIATIQAGFIGQWGEWHSFDASRANKNAVVNGLLDIYPEPYSIEIRSLKFKNEITFAKPGDENRVGFHNDYFTVGEHDKASGSDIIPGTAEYRDVSTQSPYIYMSGEMPYNEASDWGLATKISRDKTLKSLRDHHYSAFNITHNNDVNISDWTINDVTPQLLDAWKINYSPNYFVGKDDQPVKRTFFQFVRDHLGYRLNLLESSKLTAGSGSVACHIEFSNSGFATVFNPKEVYLVAIDANDKIVKEQQLDVNPRDWQPFEPGDMDYKLLTHKIEGELSGLSAGTYKIGIWMPDKEDLVKNIDSAFDVKWSLENGLTHWYNQDNTKAINVVGEVTVE